MAKKYNTRIIKLNYSYLLREVSALFNVHIRTVSLWIKEGLEIVEGLYPYLVNGRNLKIFLDKRQYKRKTKLEENQMYCMKCRKAVTPLNNGVSIIYSGKTIGNGIKDFMLKGICPNCLTNLNRLSNENKMNIVKANFTIIEEVKNANVG